MDKQNLLTVANWVAVGLTFIAQASPAIFPGQKWIPWVVAALGSIIVAITLILGFGFGWSDARGAFFYLPAGVAIGFVAAFAKREWAARQRAARDVAWRSRNQLELYEIACRATGIEPVYPVPEGAALSMMRLLSDAIKARQLACIGFFDDDLGPDSMIQVAHAPLAEFALATSNDALLKFARDWKPLPISDFSKLLYLGDVRISAASLDHDKLRFTIRCFNGSPGLASIRNISGQLEYRCENGEVVIFVPTLVDGGKVTNVSWGEELSFELDVNTPTEVAADIARRFDAGETVEFGLQNLAIACDLAAPIRETVRMPLWNGIQCAKVGGRVCVTGWIIGAAVKVTL